MSALATGAALPAVVVRPAPPGEPLETRVWARVQRADVSECWEWIGTRGSGGYGYFSWKIGRRTKTRQAHRLVYEFAVGPIPEGLELDHLCHNRICCNPAHLEPVTPAENARRVEPPTGMDHWSRRKTACLRGHPFDKRNTYFAPSGKRACRACQMLRRRLKAQAAAGALRVVRLPSGQSRYYELDAS